MTSDSAMVGGGENPRWLLDYAKIVGPRIEPMRSLLIPGFILRLQRLAMWA